MDLKNGHIADGIQEFILEQLVEEYVEKIRAPIHYDSNTMTLFSFFKNGSNIFLLSSHEQYSLKILAEVELKQYENVKHSDTFGLKMSYLKEHLPRNEVDRFLLDDLANFVGDYVYVQEPEWRHLFACYILGTWLYPAFPHFPFLYLNGPKGSGKSTITKLIADLCFNGEMLTNPTAAVIRRNVDSNRGTMALDDAEVLDGRSEESQELRSQLNSSYNTKAITSLVNKDTMMPQKLYIGGPKIFNNIRGIEEVLGDRTIQYRTERPPKDHKEWKRVPDQDSDLVRTLKTRCFIWSHKSHKVLLEIFHDFHQKTCDRESDLLNPLQSIACLFDKLGNAQIYQESLIKAFEQNKGIKNTSVTFEETVLLSTWRIYIDKGKPIDDFLISGPEIKAILDILDDLGPAQSVLSLFPRIRKALDSYKLISHSRRLRNGGNRTTFYEVNIEVLYSLIAGSKHLLLLSTEFDQD